MLAAEPVTPERPMTPDPQPLLDARRRCLLGFSGASGPLLAPMAYWSDGAHLWMTTSASTVKAARLRRDGRCAVWVPGGGEGVRATGEARVFSAADPAALVLHGAAIATAMGALAVSNASSIAGYVQDAARVPTRFLPHNRVVLRVRLSDAEVVPEPAAPPGIAPALPGVVPADVRRVVGGQRRVVVAVEDGHLQVLPAVWSAGFRLTVPAGAQLPAGAPAAVVVDVDPEHRPTGVVGVSLRGTLTAAGALDAERVTWWEGFDVTSADVPRASGSSGIVLPD
jgi:hypothetical protein